jgi:uncharacterized protein (TIGR02996 family)
VNEERAFLKAILEHPEDDALKLVYADWLEEQSDPRGEYLRLMMKVRQERVVTPEQRRRHQELSLAVADLRSQEWKALRAGSLPGGMDRQLLQRMQELEKELADLSSQLRQQIPTKLQELAATIDPNWLALLSDPVIEACGKSQGQAFHPRFNFICDQSWADMRPTGNESVRHCQTCGKNVYFCDNIADAREHAQRRDCIAVDLGVIRRKGDLVDIAFLGQPTKEDYRQAYERGADPVSRARLDARKRDGEQ